MGTEYKVLNSQTKEILTAIDDSTAQLFNTNLITLDGRAKALEAACVVEDADIRYWTTGDVPLASEGILARSGSKFIIKGNHDIKEFRCISTSSADAKVTVQYYFPF